MKAEKLYDCVNNNPSIFERFTKQEKEDIIDGIKNMMVNHALAYENKLGADKQPNYEQMWLEGAKWMKSFVLAVAPLHPAINNTMKKTTQTFWAVETTLKSGEKKLTWNWKGGKSLYWTSDKKSPPPSIFETKQDAVTAIKKSNNSREPKRIMNKLFTRIDNTAGVGKPVKIKIQTLN